MIFIEMYRFLECWVVAGVRYGCAWTESGPGRWGTEAADAGLRGGREVETPAGRGVRAGVGWPARVGRGGRGTEQAGARVWRIWTGSRARSSLASEVAAAAVDETDATYSAIRG